MPEEFLQILENNPVELEIKGIGKVLVRFPTTKEKLEAKKELRKLPNYDCLTEEEKAFYEGLLVALKCLEKPKLTVDDFLNAPDVKILNLLNHVIAWYARRTKEIADELARETGFLQEMRKP
ncbi:MAG: hypothetical protein QXK24_02975 [Ignisphaera sp.]